MISKNLIAASTKPIILALLYRGESYGYQILQRIRQVAGGKLAWSSAMLYPVLHRLEKDGFIRSKWKLSEEGRMRKYYFLTNLGRKEFAAEREQWLSVHDALQSLWAAAEASD
jgi:PadR family transcriptional regulator PadR